MEIGEFRKDTIDRINEEYDSQEERRSAYVTEIVNSICDAGECMGFDPCRFEGTWVNNRKVDIDGYYYDEEDKTLSIFLCEYNGGPTQEVITKSDIEKLIGRARNFVMGSLDETLQLSEERNAPVYYASKRIKEKRVEADRYIFYLITDNVRGEREIKDLEIEKIDEKPALFRLYDMKEYHRVSSSKKGAEIEILFENYGYEGISCIKAEEISSGSEYEAYLSIMPGKLLSDIYTKYGGLLLESNVRSFLTTKKKVNKGIKATILKEPGRFFAYNNGITATASTVKTVMGPHGLMIKSLTDLQIVNGGQTTALINSVDRSPKEKADIDAIYVPMKICVIINDNSSDIIQHISEYSNSQNSISAADFFSNSPFHVKVEQISKRLLAPPKPGTIESTRWYYERARGSYQQDQAFLSPAKKKEFQRINPKSQYITKTDLAKYRNTYDMRPDIVSKGTSYSIKLFADTINSLWESTEIKGSKINDTFYKESVSIAIIYNDLEKSISDKKLAPWYNSGYRANLLTYSIAKLISTLEEMGFTLNLDKIWKEQSVPSCLRNQLLLIAEQILSIINDPNRPVDDVREWCKKEQCWDGIKKTQMELQKEINPYVISIRREIGQNRRSARDDRVRTGDTIRSDVVSKGEEFWKEVFAWGDERGELTNDEKRILKTAFSMNSGKLPDVKQSRWIWETYEKLCRLGYNK